MRRRLAAVERTGLRALPGAGPAFGLREDFPMSRAETEADIRQHLGQVPTFFRDIPDYLISPEWQAWRDLTLGDAPSLPPKYRELIGLAVAGATRCRYCVYFHTEAARLLGATEEEINETALVAKSTMGWSTYLNTRGYEFDDFKREFDEIAAHLRRQMLAAAPN